MISTATLSKNTSHSQPAKNTFTAVQFPQSVIYDPKCRDSTQRVDPRLSKSIKWARAWSRTWWWICGGVYHTYIYKTPQTRYIFLMPYGDWRLNFLHGAISGTFCDTLIFLKWTFSIHARIDWEAYNVGNGIRMWLLAHLPLTVSAMSPTVASEKGSDTTIDDFDTLEDRALVRKIDLRWGVCLDRVLLGTDLVFLALFQS